MTMPKSKLGFLLTAVYVFIAGLIFIYAKFVCSTDALYCGMLGLIPILPTILVLSLLPFNIHLLQPPSDFSLWITYAFALLIGVVLLYFIGALIQKICALIQKRISSKITRIFSIGLIIAAIVIMGVLGIRYFNKSGMQPNFSTKNVNQFNSRDYCQQDSDCVLASQQYQDCCPSGCEVEAVNIVTKEMRNKQYNCHLKMISCPKYNCPSSVSKQAVCEQNRCVVKEKLITESQSTIDGLQFSINFDKAIYQYKKDEPIIIHGEFKNITGENIYFYTPESTLTVTYEVLDTKRKKIEIPSVIADPWLPVEEDFVLIKPNESLTKVFKLFFGIEEEVFAPGIYSIAVIYDIWQTEYFENGKSIDLNDAWSGKIKSNFIEVDIKK